MKNAGGHIIDNLLPNRVRAPSRYLVKVLADNGVDMENIWRYMIAYRLSFSVSE
jgi:hypothetical protein